MVHCNFFEKLRFTLRFGGDDKILFEGCKRRALQSNDVIIFDVPKTNVGIDEYTKFGATSTKIFVVLSNDNIIDELFTWSKYQMRKHIISSLPFMLLDITQSDQFCPSTLWDMSARMKFIRACSI